MKQLITALFLVAALVLGGTPLMTTAVAASDAAAVAAVVNLNSAEAAQMVALPGIGETIAERIVAYRTAHGPFQSVDDLVKVKGIGKKTLEKMRGMITVE